MAEWAAEIEVGEELAQTLIGGRYPALLRGGGLRRLGEGWDNVVWATAGDVAFRFPRRRIALDGVRREMALLPRLAPLVPLAIPDAAFPGEPAAGFPWPWFGSRLVAGREIAAAALTDDQRIALAAPLARFLRVLTTVRARCWRRPSGCPLPARRCSSTATCTSATCSSTRAAR